MLQFAEGRDSNRAWGTVSPLPTRSQTLVTVRVYVSMCVCVQVTVLGTSHAVLLVLPTRLATPISPCMFHRRQHTEKPFPMSAQLAHVRGPDLPAHNERDRERDVHAHAQTQLLLLCSLSLFSCFFFRKTWLVSTRNSASLNQTVHGPSPAGSSKVCTCVCLCVRVCFHILPLLGLDFQP